MKWPLPLIIVSATVSVGLAGCAGSPRLSADRDASPTARDVAQETPAEEGQALTAEERPMIVMSEELDTPRHEVVCEERKPIGSNLPKRSCYTKRNLEEVRDADRRRVEKLRFSLKDPH